MSAIYSCRATGGSELPVRLAPPRAMLMLLGYADIFTIERRSARSTYASDSITHGQSSELAHKPAATGLARM